MPAPLDDESPPSGADLATGRSDETAPEVFEEISEDGIKQLGEFRILRPLGRGGMSEVYLAEQTSLHRQVAVKVLRPELLSDVTILRRFELEAKSAAGLMHSNIVQVYSFGQQDGLYYIAQEYVQGMNLRQLLNRRGPPELLVAYHIMRQVASALTAAAEAGIVHRDIKPENILITRKGEAKVADFGLAQLAESEHRVQQLTQVGMTMGTPLYMSPEQINGENVDHRSDIYSFGVTCYRMLSGRPPFRGDTTLTLAMQHMTHTPDDLATLRPDLPPVISEIVHKMMARSPADRYQHAREITQDLQKSRTDDQGRPERGRRRAAFGNHHSHGRLRSREQRQRANRRDAERAADVARTLPRLAPLPAPDGARHRGPDSGQRVGRGRLVAAAERSAADADAQARRPPRGQREKQVERATQLRSDPDAWKAVLDYFPDDRVYTVQAKERLAVLYLRTLRSKKRASSSASWTAWAARTRRNTRSASRAKRSSPHYRRTTASRSR